VGFSASAAQHIEADGVDALHAQIRELVRTHHSSLLEQIHRLGDMLTAPAAHCAGAIAEAEFLAHQIKGAGGSLGFADIHEAATRLDDQLKRLKAQGRDAAAAEMERVQGLSADLRRTAEATTPQSSSLWDTKPVRFSARCG